MDESCIFCKIARGDVPAERVYEDDELIAIHDIHQQAPIHLLVIPKRHYATILDATDSGLLGRAMTAAVESARRMKLDARGFRLVVNCGAEGGQTVDHLHIHVLGGRPLHWPPG